MNSETLSMIYGLVLAGSAVTGLILVHREKVGLLKLVHAEVTNNLKNLKNWASLMIEHWITSSPQNLRAVLGISPPTRLLR